MMASLLDDDVSTDRPQILPPDAGQLGDQSQVSQGDAIAQLYRSVSDALARQQQVSADRGLWQGGQPWEGGGPTPTGLLNAADQYAGGLLMGTTAPGDVAPSPFQFRPTSDRPLPADNYLKPLDAHAPLMFREAAPDEAAQILPGNITVHGPMEKFLADNPDIALGQGANAGGVQLAFDASRLDGQINRAKPAWDFNYSNGTAEYVGKNTNDEFRDALVGVRVPDTVDLTKGSGRAVNFGLQRLLSRGWTKQGVGGGLTEYLPSTDGAR